jgi:hypothetical protein
MLTYVCRRLTNTATSSRQTVLVHPTGHQSMASAGTFLRAMPWPTATVAKSDVLPAAKILACITSTTSTEPQNSFRLRYERTMMHYGGSLYGPSLDGTRALEASFPCFRSTSPSYVGPSRHLVALNPTLRGNGVWAIAYTCSLQKPIQESFA